MFRDRVDSETRAATWSSKLAFARCIGQVKTAGLANAPIILRKPGHNVLDMLADAVVVTGQAKPIDAATLPERCVSDASNDGRLAA